MISPQCLAKRLWAIKDSGLATLYTQAIPDGCIAKEGGNLGRGNIIRFTLAFLLLLAWAEPSLASDGHEPRWGDFAWRVLNLILFCSILWYFTGNLIRRFFRTRKQTIQDTMTDLEKRREDARANLEEIEKRIANLEAERKAILDESQAQAERLKKGIMDDARRQAQQIVEQARLAAENEGRAMLDQVRSQVAGEIIDAAAKALRGQLSEEDHDRLIANSLDKVVL